MDLQNYRDQNQKVKPNADVRERWETRVVACRLSGASGAMQYINTWGTGWGLKKALMFARQAELMGDTPMSEIFYAKAHELEFGESASGSLSSRPGDVIVMTVAPRQETALLGMALQPGKIVTSQPTDAPVARVFYILHDGYWGMQKHDGKKELAFASASGCAWQARSMKAHAAPSQELSDAMVRVAGEMGSFVLEGEFTYLDAHGNEHRTGAQAATANINRGHASMQPVPAYYVFDCLEFNCEDIRNLSKEERVKRAFKLVAEISRYCDIVRMTPVARTENEKRALVERMVAEGREGEIWFMPHMHYHPGKHNEPYFVRTKYVQEFEANIINVAPARAEGHYIGGFEIADDEGRSLGKIGTGYSREDQQEIMARYISGDARVKIRCQGFTENGIAWHGRFIGWAE